LPRELYRVERRLLDSNIRPLDVQFVGDDHRKHGLYALTDLRILRDDRDDSIWRHPNERVRRELGGSRSARCRGKCLARIEHPQIAAE
jgi:hypothetical protein